MTDPARLGLALVATLAVGLVACSAEPAGRSRGMEAEVGVAAPGAAVETVPLRHVRLLDGPFRDAQERNLAYVMAMDPDRLLAPFLTEAGLEPRAEHYGNWEGSGLNGHIGGHYLTALSLAWAAAGRRDVLDRLDSMLDELQRAQEANGDGYLGGVPNSRELWRQIAAGDVRAEPFGLNGAWVPWYNLHKTFAGLRDAWLYADREQARDMLVQLADWAAATVAGLSDEQMQDMLRSEHGGMNEVLADVAAITGDERYLALAERFSDRRILDPLLAGRDELDGLHANTQIPKVVGFERIAEVGSRAAADGPDWRPAAEFFWHTVVHHRTVAFGGNSVREHFNPPDDFAPMIRDVQGPETCNTYNMLRLTRLLYQARPDLGYVDYYERALYNHILASQDPDSGGLVYFTPVRPRHYRVYSRVGEAMWCCVGSGMENHFKYGRFIYARDADALYVNLFLPSRLDWPQAGLVLRQETGFPDRESTRLVFEADTDADLMLRYPSWAASDVAAVRVNGERREVAAAAGSYVRLRRAWKAGDVVELELPMAPHAEGLPDGSRYVALMVGPVVLSAETACNEGPVADGPPDGKLLDDYADDSRMGHVPSGATCPLAEAPILVSGSAAGVAEHLERVDDAEMRYRFTGRIEPASYADVDLIPFFRVHHARYTLYWPLGTAEGLAARRAALADQDEEEP